MSPPCFSGPFWPLSWPCLFSVDVTVCTWVAQVPPSVLFSNFDECVLRLPAPSLCLLLFFCFHRNSFICLRHFIWESLTTHLRSPVVSFLVSHPYKKTLNGWMQSNIRLYMHPFISVGTESWHAGQSCWNKSDYCRHSCHYQIVSWNQCYQTRKSSFFLVMCSNSL